MNRRQAIRDFIIEVKYPMKELSKFEKTFKKRMGFFLSKEGQRLIREAKKKQEELNVRLFCEAFQRKYPEMFKK